MKNNNSFQILYAKVVLNSDGHNVYRVVWNSCEELNNDCTLRIDYNSKQEADAAPHVLMIENNFKIAKLEKSNIIQANDPSHIYEPQMIKVENQNNNVPYIVEWKVTEIKDK